MGWPRPAGPRDIGIVCIGDSHTEGYFPSVTVGSKFIGINPQCCGKDRDWTGTADSPYFRGVNHINVTAGTTNAMVAVGVNGPSFTTMLPVILRRHAPNRCGIIRLANLGIGGSAAYDWSGNPAKCYLQINADPQDGDTVTIGSQTYTFRAAAAVANEVTIAVGNMTTTAIRLANAVNAEGAGFGAGTVYNPEVMATLQPSGALFELYSRKIGAAGNGETLAVNAGGRITIFQAFLGGNNAPALLTNGIARVPVGFGRVDVVTITLGTNDATETGCRGRGYEAYMAQALALIEAQWPTAKVILWKPPITLAGALANNAITGVINPAVEAVASAAPNRSFVDMTSVGSGGGDAVVVDAGGVHLTGYGYSLAAEMFAARIAEALGL
jgi:hypothetical protein